MSSDVSRSQSSPAISLTSVGQPSAPGPKKSPWLIRGQEIAQKIKDSVDNKEASKLYVLLGRHLETRSFQPDANSLELTNHYKTVWGAFYSGHQRDPSNKEAGVEALRLERKLHDLGVIFDKSVGDKNMTKQVVEEKKNAGGK